MYLPTKHVVNMLGISILLTSVIGMAISAAYADDCRSKNSGFWNTSTIWTCGHVPQNGDDVVIRNGYAIALPSGTNTAKLHSLRIANDAGTQLTCNDPLSNGFRFQDGAEWINNNSVGAFDGDCEVVFHGTATIRGDYQTLFRRLELHGTTTLQTTPIIEKILAMKQGSSVDAAPEYQNNAILRYNTNETTTAGSEWGSSGTALPPKVQIDRDAGSGVTRLVVNDSRIVSQSLKIKNFGVLQLNGGATLSFTNGAIMTIHPGGNFEPQGTSCINQVALTSSGSWTLQNDGTADADYVTVRNSTAIGNVPIIVPNGADSGGNTGWTFTNSCVAKQRPKPTVNTPPEVIKPIQDSCVTKGDAPITFSLFPNVADAQDADNQLTYTVIYNRNPKIAESSEIASTDGNLTLTFLHYGVTKIGVRVTDRGGLYTDLYFRVIVGLPMRLGGSLQDLCTQTGLGCQPGASPQNPRVGIQLEGVEPKK